MKLCGVEAPGVIGQRLGLWLSTQGRGRSEFLCYPTPNLLSLVGAALLSAGSVAAGKRLQEREGICTAITWWSWAQSFSHMCPNGKEKKALQGRSYDVSCCSYSAWSQVLPQCFVPACSSAIRFLVWHFFLPYSWILHLGSVTSLLTPCHHSHCCSITDLGCGIPERRTAWETLMGRCVLPSHELATLLLLCFLSQEQQLHSGCSRRSGWRRCKDKAKGTAQEGI